MSGADGLLERNNVEFGFGAVTGILNARFRTIGELRPAVIGSDDADAVHDMRVATRRLRSAIADLTPFLKKKPRRIVNSELRLLANALGGVRDLDVEIASLGKLAARTEDPEIAATIGELMDSRRNERAESQSGLEHIIGDEAFDRLFVDFEPLLGEVSESRLRKFEKKARALVIDRIEEFRDLAHVLYDPNDVKGLHRLRIVAKQLRYAIELFAVPADDKFSEFADEVADMQTYLGELHDADVWFAKYSELALGSEDKRLRRALVWLLTEISKDRNKNYRSALGLWARWDERDFLEKLAANLGAGR
jgi:CHAD domain-containing protein